MLHPSKSIWRKMMGDNPGPAWLFVALLAFFIAFPIAAELVTGGVLLDFLFFAMLVFSTYAVSRERKVLLVAILLAMPTMAFWLSARHIESTLPGAIGLALSAMFFAYVVVVLLREVVSSEKIDGQTIYGAMSAYLLIGITWSFVYALVELSTPGAFDFGLLATTAENESIHAQLRFFVYYSLVTLSTLGYGDITPLAPLARTLASLEAVMGQLYIAVLVAQLVGTRIAQQQGS